MCSAVLAVVWKATLPAQRRGAQFRELTILGWRDGTIPAKALLQPSVCGFGKLCCFPPQVKVCCLSLVGVFVW